MTSTTQTHSTVMQSNSTIVLDRTDIVWRVESGNVSIFCATLDEQGTIGPRRFLWEAKEGSLLVGGVFANQTLLAVAFAKASVTEINLSELPARFDNPLTAVIDFVQRLSSLWKCDRSRQSISMQPSKAISISTDMRIHGDFSGLAFVKVLHGRVALMGGAIALTPESTPLVVDRRLWIEGREPSKLQFEVISEATSIANVLDGVNFLREHLLGHLAEVDALALEAQSRRLQIRDELVSQETIGAIDELCHAWNREATHIRGASPLWSVLSVIGRELNCTFHAGHTEKKKNNSDLADKTNQTPENSEINTLADIMRASRVRTREVLLTQNWFRSDSGPLIGKLISGNRPVALLWRADRYEMVDPTAGTREWIDEKIEARLFPLAVSVVRPLSEDRDHSFAALLQFSLSRYKRDLFALIGLWVGLILIFRYAPGQTKPLVDDIIPNAKYGMLWITAVVLVAVAMCQSAFSLCQRLFVVRMQSGISTDAQMAVLDRVLRLPQRFLARFSAGDLTHRVMTVTDLSADIGANALWGILSSTATMVSMTFYFLQSPLASRPARIAG